MLEQNQETRLLRRDQAHIPSAVLRASTRLHIPKGKQLFVQGGEIDSVYYLVSGKIGVYNLNSAGDQTCVTILRPGDFIGEMEILCDQARVSYMAMAHERCEVMRITKDHFIDWLKSDAEFLFGLTKTLANKLNSSATNVSHRIGSNALTIFKKFIVDCAEEHFAKCDAAFTLQRTRAEIADICSVSERTINRTVHALCDGGFITVKKGKIVIAKDAYNRLRETVLGRI